MLNTQVTSKTSNQTKSKEKLQAPPVSVHNLSEKPPHTKNIEIYATLPKKKNGVMARVKGKSNESPTKNIIEDAEYLIYDRPGRDRNRGRDKNDKALSPVKEKRARSEERSKKSDFNSSQGGNKESPKKFLKESEVKSSSKKQHKIRRKLLMGGLIKRKNRSMPDLREDEDLKGADLKTQDDSNLKSTTMIEKQLSGYLSEGHLEFAGSTTNPNLERSRLMRKSFHGSAGKVLHAAKVPPPPPLRTTSQLSKAAERPKYPLPDEVNPYNNIENLDNGGFYNYDVEPRSLPFLPTYTADTYTVYKDDAVQYANGNICAQNESTQLVTRAQIHQEPHSTDINEDFDNAALNLPLPPYPSPLNSAVHSRQASEEFPPPPEEVLKKEESSLLTQLQIKRQQILTEKSKVEKPNKVVESNATQGNQMSANPLLKELQAKLQQKLNKIEVSEDTVDFVGGIKAKMEDTEKTNSVKDLASKFEHIRVVQEETEHREKEEEARKLKRNSADLLKLEKPNVEETQPEPAAMDLGATQRRSDPMMSTNFTMSVLKLTGGEEETKTEETDLIRRKSGGKKKNVTFCDQVVLVATADDDEEDNFIPNPILERVLRSALNKDSNDKTARFPRGHPVYKTEFFEHEKNQLQTKMTPGERPKQPVAYHGPAHSVHPSTNHETEMMYNVRSVGPHLYTQPVEPRLNPSVPDNGRLSSQSVMMSESGKMFSQEPDISKVTSLQYPAKVEGYRVVSPQILQHDLGRCNTHYPPAPENSRGYHPQYVLPPDSSKFNPQQAVNNIQSQQYSQHLNIDNTRIASQYPIHDQLKMNGIIDSRPVQQPHPYMHVPQFRNQTYTNPPDLQASPNRFLDCRKPIREVINDQSLDSGRGSVAQTDKSASVRLAVQKTPQMGRAAMSLSQSPPFSSTSNLHRQNPGYQMVPKNLPARMAGSQVELKPNFPPYYHPLPNKVPPSQTSYPRNEPKTRLPQSAFPPYQQPPPPKQIPVKFTNKQLDKPPEQIMKLNEMRQSQENLLQSSVKTNPCHLCRKKQVAVPGLYCSGCDFYMSRFRPKS